jgi:hypothetical protein
MLISTFMRTMRITTLFILVLVMLICCTKKQGINPALAYNDLALLDSCQKTYHRYYKNDASTILSGSAGPHGTFKLRFNSVASKALGSDGKLPTGRTFPDGSLIIKDVVSGGNITLYAFMYKKSGSWLWAEVKPNKEVIYSVTKNPSGCTGCHSQSGNRDLVVSFNFY